VVTALAGLALPAPGLTDAELRAWADGWLTGYNTGWRHGFDDGCERYDRRLIKGLTLMLGGPEATGYRDAVKRHERSRRAKAAREEWTVRQPDMAPVRTDRW
jgi:hypothetical protein